MPDRTRELQVLIASYLEPALVERVRSAHQEVQVVYRPDLLPVPRYRSDHDGVRRALSDEQRAEWAGLLREADICFDFDWEEPSRLVERAPRLAWIQATSSGIGEFLQCTQLVESELIFTTAAGVHAGPLAEFVLLGLLYLTKEVPMLLEQQQRRQWERYTAHSLAGTKALVVGLGHVGDRISEVLTSVGVEVWGGVRPGRTAPPPARKTVELPDLREALPEVNALVLSCPLTAQTQGLIGKAELEALPAGALLVNVARGVVVDEEALVNALSTGHLGGAALDVFATEPLPPESPLWAMNNVLISPHSASTVADENNAIVDLFVDNLHRYLGGRPLLNVFSRDDAY